MASVEDSKIFLLISMGVLTPMHMHVQQSIITHRQQSYTFVLLAMIKDSAYTLLYSGQF